MTKDINIPNVPEDPKNYQTEKPLGYYMEGDYMEEKEDAKDVYKYISPTSPTGFKLEIVDHTILITGPNKSVRSFTFDEQEDWENFCEATWDTENYVGIKKSDFIEFFQAMKFVYSYHDYNLKKAIEQMAGTHEQIKKQTDNLEKMKTFIDKYQDMHDDFEEEEKKNESKI